MEVTGRCNARSAGYSCGSKQLEANRGAQDRRGGVLHQHIREQANIKDERVKFYSLHKNLDFCNLLKAAYEAVFFIASNCY